MEKDHRYEGSLGLLVASEAFMQVCTPVDNGLNKSRLHTHLASLRLAISRKVLMSVTSAGMMAVFSQPRGL